MGQIYLAYRRDDSAAISGRIADRLRARFGAEAVLKDVNEAQTAGGVVAALRQCSALVVVIGPRWLSGVLAEPNSQTYVEIVTALNRGIPIIPTLVHGATPPDFRLLPALAPFVTHSFTTLGSASTFDRDMEALCGALQRAAPRQGYRAPERGGSARRPALPGALGAQARLARLAGRALLVALVLAMVIGSVGGGSLLLARRRPSSTPVPFTIPSGVQLLDIANPPGSGDLWAVGGARETGDSCVLLHEAGGIWSKVDCPLHVELDSVSFVNDGDGWAVGTSAEANGCGLLHFYDGSWTAVACPKGVSFGSAPVVRMNSQGDGWIVGGSTKFENSIVLHYVNGTWKIYPTDTTSQLTAFTKLAVSKQSGFWGLALSEFFNAVSGRWVDVLTNLGLPLDATFTCYSLDFAPTGVGWAVGSVQLTIGATPRAYILDYQHGVWSAYPQQRSVGPLTLVRAGLFGEVWVAGGPPPSDSFSPVGGGLIMRYNGQKWTTLGDPIDGQIYGIADVPNGDAWAVGDNGQGTALLWYHGGFWRIFRATAN